MWLHVSKFHKLPIFPLFFQEKRSFHMVNQKPRCYQWMPLSQGLICTYWCGSTHILPVKIGLHTSKFHKLPIFPVFSQEKRPLHMVKQKHRYGPLMPVNPGLIFLLWCGSNTCFPVKFWLHASKFHKLSSFLVSSQEKRPLHMVNQEHRYDQFIPLSQGLIFI